MDQLTLTNGLDLVNWIFNPHHLSNCEKHMKEELAIFTAFATPTSDLGHNETETASWPRGVAQSTGSIRVVMDAAFKDGESANGIVAKEENDKILIVATSLFLANTLLEAELQALEMGLL
ncbi:hypothetical protein TorRG33x02_285770 [Trema orientale]|uniref:RNase H type-1 domain-containing protein n=1 Tax=Trema orientale TaxID=63057 RepID=A0A2P5CGB2_TREOI|nr:hypothetical protein TorRG33x02_285770 [Trema orientale]